MGRRGSGMRHISTSIIAINTFYNIFKERVVGILRPKYTASIITTAITSFIDINNIMNTTIRNR